MRFLRLAVIVLIVGLLGAECATAQTVTYSGGSVYDLDPKVSQRTSDRILEQILTNNDLQPVNDMAEADVLRKLARPVGRLALGLNLGEVSYCTASVIAKDLVLTNYHCVPGRGDVRLAMLWMGYVKPRSRRGVGQYPVDLKPVEADEALDYAILRVQGNPGEEWGRIALSTQDPLARTSLFIVHHPGGFTQHISRGRCQTSDPATDGDDILHVCDTLGGSSGAPIFDNNTRKVIGLHYSAVALRDLNAGKRIASIAKRSPILTELAATARTSQPSGANPPGVQPPMSPAAMAWAAVQNTTSVAVLEAFIQKFSDTVFVDFAKARLVELERVARLPQRLEDPNATDLKEPTESILSGTELATALQSELKRLGCLAGKLDGKWGPMSHRALERFATQSGQKLGTDKPTARVLAQLKVVKERVCPIVCGAGQTRQGDRCVQTVKRRSTNNSKKRRKIPEKRLTSSAKAQAVVKKSPTPKKRKYNRAKTFGTGCNGSNRIHLCKQ